MSVAHKREPGEGSEELPVHEEFEFHVRGKRQQFVLPISPHDEPCCIAPELLFAMFLKYASNCGPCRLVNVNVTPFDRRAEVKFEGALA